MNYSEICEALEEEYKTIGFLRSTGQYKAAANNIRQVLEMICEYYGELYQISDFKSDRYKLFEKIKFLHKNNRIDKKTKEAFFNLKNLGNRGSHYKINEDVSQLQIDRALPILRAEIDKFIEKTKPVHSINNNNVLFPFKTLSEEGWYGKQKIKSEFQLYNAEGDDSPYYVENVIYTLPNKIAPKFLYDYVVQNKLPLIAWDLDKRVIKQDRNEYFCHVNIPVFDKTGDILYVVAHFVKDNDSNEVIVFDIECNNQIFYHYDKYKRQLSGIWCDKKDEIEKSIRIINLGNGLSDLQEDSLVLAFHYGLPQYAIYKVKNVCCIDDENNDMAIALSQSGDLLYEKENISDNVKIVVGDIYRLHCLNNCLKKYLKTDVKLDDWRDISELSLRDGLYTIPFLYDYLLGFQRDNEKTVFYLVDTYSDVAYAYEIEGERTFFPITHRFLSNAPIEIEFKALLKKMQQIGCYGLSELLVDNISYETVIDIYRSILQAEEEQKELQKRAIAEKERQKELERLECEEKQRKLAEQKEIARIEYEEKQRKIAEQKQVEEKKNRKKSKRESRRKWIKENSRWIAPFMPILILILIPILFLTVYALFAVVIIQVNKFADSMPKYVNINDYVSVEVEGYEGIGEVELVFDYERLEADYGDKIKYNSGVQHSSGEPAFDIFFEMCEYDIIGNEQLSNGDEVCFVWGINNDEMQKYFNYGVEYEDITYTVDGLEKVDFFNAFDSLTYSIEGVSMDATLSMQSTINIDGYPGLIFTSDKTEAIANNDVITIRLETENGEDVYDYCINRYGVVPENRKLEIVVSGLPEYITSYEQITEEQLNIIIAEGEQHVCDYFNYDVKRGISCEAEYQGNYFYSSNDRMLETHNGIVIVYHINRQQKVGNSSASYDFYEVYSIQNIYITSEGQLIVNYDDWEHTYHKIDAPVLSHSGYNTTSEIYPNFIERYEEEYYVQNNMQNVVDSN